MDVLTHHKLYEMISPGLSPPPPRGTLGAAPTAVLFTDTSGKPITSIVCGGSYITSIPGSKPGAYHMIIYNSAGAKRLEGDTNLPSQAMSGCTADNDPVYDHYFYDIDTGQLIGQGRLSILPTSAVPPPPGTGPTAGGIGDWFASLSMGAWLAIGAGAFLLLRRRK